MLPIGGSCFFGTLTKINRNINTESYPFDFLRTHFLFIIECIKNDFLNFLPKDCSNPQIIDKLFIYNMGDHCFYHHDLRDNQMLLSFYRRINRFKLLLENNENEIIFLRSISNPKIKNEINLRHTFFNILKNKYPNLKYKLIFVEHRNDDNLLNINCEKIDDKTFIFTIGNKPVVVDNNTNFDINLQKNYDRIIDFITENDYLNNFNINKIIINSNNLKYSNDYYNINSNIYNYDYNSFALDFYP